ncbi:photosynthetic complex assembly protein PuhC [Rhodopseudomonas sp. BAL398]|uniref:photosynthetic complex assembly protein PuhC n=1 Tax=Rhodopseudomonas sp. BAL398 TaxID=3034676 RepID=UPI0039829638
MIAAAAVVFLALAAATTARLTGYGVTHMTLPAMVESIDLQFEDDAAGNVLVFDARDHKLLHSLPPGESGFVRVVLRGMARERMLASIGSEPPFRLARYENGQLTLTDTANNRLIDLNAFGSSNLAAFAQLMKKPDGSK